MADTQVVGLEVMDTIASREQRGAIERIAIRKLVTGVPEPEVRRDLESRYWHWLYRFAIRRQGEDMDIPFLQSRARVMVRQFFVAVEYGTFDKQKVTIPFGHVRRLRREYGS